LAGVRQLADTRQNKSSETKGKTVKSFLPFLVIGCQVDRKKRLAK
jgi:hypothetical protein